MDRWREWKWLAIGIAAFAGIFFLPVGTHRFDNAVLESLHLLRWYAREHVLLCLVPAFFIAGAISVFVSQASVLKYLGAGANRVTAYAVASVSGTILAVCSCTVLPLFASIYKRGAGLGPAAAFLYSGPAINVLAIVLTARVLGWRLGAARAVGAIVFSIAIGLVMQAFFRTDEQRRTSASPAAQPVASSRPLGYEATYFASLVGVLVFANWAEPSPQAGFWHAVFDHKWPLTILSVLVLVASVIMTRSRDEVGDWVASTWDFAKLITPLLLLGVLLAGLLLGRPGHDGLIPSEWVRRSVGGNSLGANLFAAVAGALMYFATLTEVPIVQGLVGSGMGQGPALALLLAGPALSLPSILVMNGVLGTRKTTAYVGLVVLMATVSGLIFGAWA